MYTNPSASYPNPNIDLNVQRILADTLTMVNDVDQRLTTLRQGIAQAFPQLAPLALSRPNMGITPGAFGGLQGSVPSVFPQAQGFPTTSPFQSPGFSGVPFQTLPFLGQNVSPFLGLHNAFPGISAGYPPTTAPSAGSNLPLGLFGQPFPSGLQGVTQGAWPGVSQGSAPSITGFANQAPQGFPTMGPTGVVGPTFRGY